MKNIRRIFIIIFTILIVGFLGFRFFFFIRSEAFTTKLAVAFKDAEMCENIFELPCGGEGCATFRCARKVVENIGDVKVCKSNYFAVASVSGYGVDDCYRTLALLHSDESLCALSVTPGGVAECYYAMAKKKDDSSICEHIPKGTEVLQTKGTCYSQFVQNTKDFSICAKLNAQSEREVCIWPYLFVGEITSKFCTDNFINSDALTVCFHRAAISSKDPTVCNNIKTPVKSRCFYDLARVKLDLNLCNSIIDSSDLKSRCTEDVNSGSRYIE